MKIIMKIIAVVFIITAIYLFDWHTWNQILGPLLMLSVAASILTEKNRKLNKFFARTSLVISVLLILKILILG